MVLRWIASNMLRRAAHEKMAEAVAEAARQRGAAPGEGRSEPPSPPPPTDIGIVFALGAEAGGTVDRLRGTVVQRGAGFDAHSGQLGGRHVAVITTGPGKDAALRGTTALLTGHRPRFVISAGFAGGLTDELSPRDLVLANSVVNQQGHEQKIDIPFDARSAESKSVHEGRLLTVDHLVRLPAEKRKLGQAHSALAVDMETFAIAELCRRENVPFLSVRIISDAVDDELPADIENLLRQDNLSGRAGAAVGAIFRRPESLRDMWKLKEDALVASDRLAQFLENVVRSLQT